MRNKAFRLIQKNYLTLFDPEITVVKDNILYNINTKSFDITKVESILLTYKRYPTHSKLNLLKEVNTTEESVLKVIFEFP